MMKSVEGAILKDAGLRLLERFIEPADPEDHVARNREATAVDVPEAGRISRRASRSSCACMPACAHPAGEAFTALIVTRNS
jgi:hypothetical protein